MAWLSLATVWVGLGSHCLAQELPQIDDFSPKAGTPGDVIQLTGSGFSTGLIRVFFWNGVQALPQITSDSFMQIVVPSGTTTGPLAINRDGGRATFTAENFLAIGPGPYITDFSPSFGATNDLVTINGVHFSGVAANGVKFGGVRSTDAYANADGTQINVHVPYGAPVGSSSINVTTSFGNSNSPIPFLVIGPGPYITGFLPDHGSAGTVVYIDGVHFANATSATFNGVTGGSFAVQSDTLIRVSAPANVRTGPIQVSSPLGSSTSSSNFFVAPSISSLSTTNGRTGTNITIYGVNFRGATSVLFNGTEAAFTIVNNTNIQATVPAGAITGTIRVNTPYYSCFSPANFIIRPTIYGFTPHFGPVGTSVTVNGANFNVGTPVVRFNGVQAAAPTGVTFGQLTAVVPSGANTGPISISTTDGSHTNANKFYLPATITSFTPTNSAPGSRVRINGQNFSDATVVAFNGAPAVFTISNNTTIGVTVPAGVSSGPVSVTTPAGTAVSSGVFYGSPTIDSFSPVAGLPGTNVTIFGTNFLGTRAVRFNGLAASINSVNNGQIVAVVPIGAQTGPITVEAPAGTNTSATNFVVDYPSQLEVWMTDSPDPVTMTSNLTYSVTMINRGPFVAPNVRITNTLPANVSFISASIPQPWTVARNSNIVVASTASVAVGGTETLTIIVAPQATGPLLDSAAVTSDHVDPIPGNNVYATTTYVLPLPLLSIRLWTNQVRVSWPAALTNFLLEARTNLVNASWTVLSNPVTISGTQQYVLDATNSLSKYYRLKQ